MCQDKRRQIDAALGDGCDQQAPKLPKKSTSNSSKNRMSFAGFTRESANVDFTQQLKNDSGVVLKPGTRPERPGQLGLQVQSIFGQY